MAALGGISGKPFSQVALTGDATAGTTASGKTNTYTNTGKTSNTTTKTNNTTSSQNTSSGTGVTNAGTSASNSVSNGGNTTNITVAPPVKNKTNPISLQEAEAQRVAAEAKARQEAEAKARQEAEAKARQEAEEAFRKSEAEEAQKRAYKAELAEAARKAAEQEKDKSFMDAVIDMFEKIRYHSEYTQKINNQVLVEQVKMVNTTMNQLWDNYMFSMELNQATTMATAEGIMQWSKIISGDASDLTEEESENLHMALDAMSTLPGGGVYDWLNAELYEAEGNMTMAATSTLAVVIPGVLPTLNQATKYLTNGSDLIDLIFRSGSVDEAVEGMIKYGGELQEAGETLAKQLAEEGAEKAGEKVVKEAVEGGLDVIKLSGNNIQHIKKHTFEGMAEQAKYLTDEQLASKLANTTFFNKNWSQDEVVKYTQEAYNALRNQGKTGLHSVEINGEVIKVFIKDDGTFDTAYGVYRYMVDDFR